LSDLPLAPSLGVVEVIERAKSLREFSNLGVEEALQLEIPASFYPPICERTVYRSGP
jgi:hypothetical protein